MKRILQPPKDVKSMNFFTENMMFPMVLYAKSEWEDEQIKYLKNRRHNNLSLCLWCSSHDVHFQVLYPLSKKDIIMHPIKYLYYLKLKRLLRKTQ